MKNRTFAARLGFALNGIGQAWREERSFRTQSLFALATVAALVALRPGLHWSAIVVIMIGLVLAAEMVNASLEALADRLHPEIHPEIKKVKDLAAGAVLVLSLSALGVAALMLVSLYWS